MQLMNALQEHRIACDLILPSESSILLSMTSFQLDYRLPTATAREAGNHKEPNANEDAEKDQTRLLTESVRRQIFAELFLGRLLITLA